MLKIAINGFGRIGRLLLRAIYENNFQDKMQILQVNSPGNAEHMAHLFKYDSTHGIFNGHVEHDASHIFINQDKIKVTTEKIIEDIDWADNIDLIFESSGKFNDKEKLLAHFKKPNIKKLIVSAPTKNADLTIIRGVNDSLLNENNASARVISIGSCTTNCQAPLLKMINDLSEIEVGFVTTVHAYTGDQNLLDASHKDLRRARGACQSMIPTSTGASKLIGDIIPSLKGKIEGAAIRVPVANVSMLDMKLKLKDNITNDILINFIKDKTENELKGIISYSNLPLVSIDFNKNPNSAIIDLLELKILQENFLRLVAWYDNEYAFALRMLEVALLCM